MKISTIAIIMGITISLIECIKFINISQGLMKIQQSGINMFRLISDKSLSDAEKEKGVPKEAFKMFRASFKLLFSLASLILIIFILNEIFKLVSINLVDELVSISGICISILTIFIYTVLKRRK